MHNIEELCELKEKLIKELIEQGKKDGTLNNIDTLAHAIKNICKIVEDAEQYEDEYSGRRYSRAQGGGSGRGGSGAYANAPYSYAYMPAYSMASMGMMPEYAWAQGGGSGASGAQGGGSGAYGGGSGARRSGRYSSHSDLVSELYSVMEMAKTEQERQQIQDLINRMG